MKPGRIVLDILVTVAVMAVTAAATAGGLIAVATKQSVDNLKQRS